MFPRMPAHFDVIVAGLGAMGSAAAAHLASRGQRVLGLDRFAPPHTFGSSHGQTRIIREAYFESPAYVPLVQRAYELWDELAKETNRELFRQTGGLMIGAPDGVLVTGTQRSAELHRLPYQCLSAREIQCRFPALHPSEAMMGIWEPRAGILFPEQCLLAHLDRARRNGATLHVNETILRWRKSGQGVRVVTDQGEYSAARLVLAAGSWLQSLLPDWPLPLVVERQVLFWFNAVSPEQFHPSRCPIHLWEHAPDKFFYGFPDLGGGVKLARHHEGEITTAETVRRKVTPDESEELLQTIRPFLPAIQAPAISSAVCVYTNTPDGHFLIDSPPEAPQVLVASPCSGHGFKFSSALGEALADLIVTGETRFDLSLFRHRWPASSGAGGV